MKVTIKKEISAGVENRTKELIWFDSFYRRMLKFNCDGFKYERIEEKYIIKNGNNIPLNEAVNEIIKNYNIPKLSLTEKIKYAEKYLDETCGIKKAYRIKAVPENYKRKEKSKKKSIIQLFNEYENYNHSTVELLEDNNNEVIFEVNDKELEDFCYFLERNGIKYE